MFAFLIRHSLVFMIVAALLGFVFPKLSSFAFPFLPYILFGLMTLTLLGMKQNELIRHLGKKQVWLYSLLHSAFFMLLIIGVGRVFSLDANLLLAMVSIAATGSLFATPAIVRALGFDSMQSMAMTIATTLMLPGAIFITLVFCQTEDIRLDMVSYGIKLLIFILGPMIFSFWVHRIAPEQGLNRFIVTISPYTIFLVFAFPFGMIGSFRRLYDADPIVAFYYFLVAVGLCLAFFAISFFVYRKRGKELALIAAITSGNRNVLLTYTIAGGLLGPAFLPLAGALQVPTCLLPVLTRWLNRVL